jgi:ubiquinone/menaquinone biosynthesis C-methylase UbiE
MATILRDWSYRYQWLYDTVSFFAALTVGGTQRLHRLGLQQIDLATAAHWEVLDLCCGAGAITEVLVQYFDSVTGLDASPVAIKRAQAKVPQAKYVTGFAEQMPLGDQSFDLVITNTAMHEMTTGQLEQIFAEVHRVLKRGGKFVIVDFHPPQNPLYWGPVALFLYLFETETAWELLRTNLPQQLQSVGFGNPQINLYAGGSLQVLQVEKL